MRISYPNASDKIKGSNPLGGAIMIHGNCVTIGCVPITDDKIKELYVLCLQSKNQGNDIKVHSYPFKLTTENLTAEKTNYSKELIDFWMNLKVCYDYFSQNKQLPKIKVDKKGNYGFN